MEKCEICDNQINVGYGRVTCGECGQVYEYDTGSYIVLTAGQILILQAHAIMTAKCHKREAVHPLLDIDGPPIP